MVFKGVNIVPVTLDDSDVRIMASHLKQNLEFTLMLNKLSREWVDYGYYTLFPLLFFSLFWFRRGWMVHWTWVTMLCTGCSSGETISLKNLFSTPDQQAVRLYQEGKSEQAGTLLFSDPSWKGYVYSKREIWRVPSKRIVRMSVLQDFITLGSRIHKWETFKLPRTLLPRH